MGGIQLDLGIEPGGPALVPFRVMDFPVGIQFGQEAFEPAVVRLDNGGIQAFPVRLQAEIHLGESPGLDRYRLREIPQQMGRQDGCRRIPRLDGIPAVHVGGDADGRPVEIHPDKGDRLPG